MALNPFLQNFYNTPGGQRHQATISRMRSMFGGPKQPMRLPAINSMSQAIPQGAQQQPTSPVRTPQNPYVNNPSLGARMIPSNAGLGSYTRPQNFEPEYMAEQRQQRKYESAAEENWKKQQEYMKSIAPIVSDFQSRYGTAGMPSGYTQSILGGNQSAQGYGPMPRESSPLPRNYFSPG